MFNKEADRTLLHLTLIYSLTYCYIYYREESEAAK